MGSVYDVSKIQAAPIFRVPNALNEFNFSLVTYNFPSIMQLFIFSLLPSLLAQHVSAPNGHPQVSYYAKPAM
jgi:hypothetical protein